MGSNVMHIAGDLSTLAHILGFTSNPKALCGVRIPGSDRNAPLCPKCFRLSGWTRDKRR